MLKQNYILFRKTPQCFWPSIVAIIFCILYSVYKFIEDSLLREFNYIDIVEHTDMMLGNSIYYYILFLYLSFEYTSIVKKTNVVESISTYTMSSIKRESQQLLILSIINVLLCMCMLVICICLCILSGSSSADFYIYTIKAIFTHVFMVNTCAVMTGLIISYINNTILAYLALFGFTIVAILQSGKFTFPAEDKIGSIQEISNIFCASLTYIPDEAALIPVNIHFLSKPLYIVFGVISVYLITNFFRYKKLSLIFATIFSVLCSFSFIYICNIPYNGSNPGYADDSSDLFANEQELLTPTKEIDFYVTEYNIHFDIRKNLIADMYMQLSDTSLPEYHFILCKDYNIDYIADDKDNAIRYSRNGNKLCIYNEAGNLSSIYIKYTGKSYNICYTGENGAYLPGNFPYYPIAGNGDLFQNGYCQLPEDLSRFIVSICYDFTTYSNLSLSGNAFSGFSNQLSIVSGIFWREQIIDNVRYIFPYIGADTDPSRNHYITSQIKKYINYTPEEKATDYSLIGKTILIQPIHRNAYMYGSDMVMFDAAGNLDIYYTNYIQTGNWYNIDSILTDEELQKIQEDVYDELGITETTE